ncbi:HLA class II histocompatibility antigen, DR beta 5 chain-like [Cyanocitta cristata]
MGRVAAAGAVLVALVVLGAPPAAGMELSGERGGQGRDVMGKGGRRGKGRVRSPKWVSQYVGKARCHFINGADRVRFMERHIYNREQLLHFDFFVSISLVPTSYQLSPGCQLGDGFLPFRDPAMWIEIVGSNKPTIECSLFCKEERVYRPGMLDTGADVTIITCSEWPGNWELEPVAEPLTPYPAVIATDIVPNRDWTHQLLVLLETPPGCLEGLGLSVRGFWGVLTPLDSPEMLLDTTYSKMLTGIGGFVLGFIFLGLGLSFYLCKKMTGGPGGCVPAPPRACVLPQPGAIPFSLPTEFLSWRRLQPLPMASGLAGIPPLRPHTDFGGVVCPPQPHCHSAPAWLLPVFPIKLPSSPQFPSSIFSWGVFGARSFQNRAPNIFKGPWQGFILGQRCLDLAGPQR